MCEGEPQRFVWAGNSDLYGDWRSELVWRTPVSATLRSSLTRWPPGPSKLPSCDREGRVISVEASQ